MQLEPVATNCIVPPTLRVMAVGVIAIEVTTAVVLVTVNVVDPLTPLKDAPIVELPAATPVARPGAACPVV